MMKHAQEHDCSPSSSDQTPAAGAGGRKNSYPYNCDDNSSSMTEGNKAAATSAAPAAAALKEKEKPQVKNSAPYEKANLDLVNVKTLNDSDVICGRGGGSNHHKGNLAFRKLVQDMKPRYEATENRKEKGEIAWRVVNWIRYEQTPPGRFLTINKDGTWHDIGDREAKHKTSQTLREKKSNDRSLKADGLANAFSHGYENIPQLTPSASTMSSSRPRTRTNSHANSSLSQDADIDADGDTDTYTDADAFADAMAGPAAGTLAQLALDWIPEDKPRERDVLLGRGGRSNSHTGNKRFRALVVHFKPTYKVAQSNKEKQAIVKSIVSAICEEILESGAPVGRFIKFDLSCRKWYNVGLAKALNKTSQALREDNQCNNASAKPFVDSLGMWNNHKPSSAPMQTESQIPSHNSSPQTDQPTSNGAIPSLLLSDTNNTAMATAAASRRMIESPHLNRIVQNMMGGGRAATDAGPPPPPLLQNNSVDSAGSSSGSPPKLRNDLRAVTREYDTSGLDHAHTQSRARGRAPDADASAAVNHDDAYLYGNGNNHDHGYGSRYVTQEYDVNGYAKGAVSSAALPALPPPSAQLMAALDLKHRANVNASEGNPAYNSASTGPKRVNSNNGTGNANTHQQYQNQSAHNMKSFPPSNLNGSSSNHAQPAPQDRGMGMNMDRDMHKNMGVSNPTTTGIANTNTKSQPVLVPITYAPAILKINPRSKMRRSYSDTFVSDFNLIKKENFTRAWKDLKVMSSAPNFVVPPQQPQAVSLPKPVPTAIQAQAHAQKAVPAARAPVPAASVRSSMHPPQRQGPPAAAAAPSFAPAASASSSGMFVPDAPHHASSLDHEEQQHQQDKRSANQHQLAAMLRSRAAAAEVQERHQAEARLEALRRLGYYRGAQYDYAGTSRGGEGERMEMEREREREMKLAYQLQKDHLQKEGLLYSNNHSQHSRQLSNVSDKPESISRTVTDLPLDSRVPSAGMEERFRQAAIGMVGAPDANASTHATFKSEGGADALIAAAAARPLIQQRIKYENHYQDNQRASFDDTSAAAASNNFERTKSMEIEMAIKRDLDMKRNMIYNMKMKMDMEQPSNMLSEAPDKKPLPIQMSSSNITDDYPQMMTSAAIAQDPAPKRKRKQKSSATSKSTSPRKKRAPSAIENETKANVNDLAVNIKLEDNGIAAAAASTDPSNASVTEDVKKSINTTSSNIMYKPFDDKAPLATHIQEPRDQDVLFGRGGRTNHHLGNKRFRQLVEDHRQQYRQLQGNKRKQKIALEIVELIYSQDNGRFLKLSPAPAGGTGLWQDVGKKIARGKTSQALREAATTLTKQQNRLKASAESSEPAQASPTSDTDTASRPPSRAESPSSYGNGDIDTKDSINRSASSTPPPPLPQPTHTLPTTTQIPKAAPAPVHATHKTQDDQDLGMLLMSLKSSTSPKAV